MGRWKEEDFATREYILEYLTEFKAGIECNPQFVLNETEKARVHSALAATETFCLEMLGRKNKLYMHDLILMAVGFYGGYLTALDVRTRQSQPDIRNN
ncbi:MAG TPA: hypothetical protein VLH15_01475 [Dehalococcoidales bacterium]|nr:hypothetical protein [Dehalococcoidales bacterium]